MLHTERDGDVTVLRMDAEENRFNPVMLGALEGALDDVDATEGPAAIVLSGTGKFFSNGLDLEWMTEAGQEGAEKNVDRVQALFSRVLTSGVPVVAALNGHTFAAGAMLALACDERVMRKDRGFFCLPEADINIPFTPGMSALIRAKLDVPAAREAMLTAKRYGGADALKARIVDLAEGEKRVEPVAIARAQDLSAKGRFVIAAIKREMYAGAIEALARPFKAG
ncbi:MAG: enoyl-CoA hydratase/isomerase family protein [Actinomycetota bacterium]|nr:enoyl-CoA hydratase/isomerase family protein [Actinomycetota bacterium]